MEQVNDSGPVHVPAGERSRRGVHVRLPSFLCVDSPSPSMLSYGRTGHVGGGSITRGSRRKPASPRRPGASSIKRKQDTAYYEPRAFVEPCLVQLCRLGKWNDVLDRCDLFRPDLRLIEVHEAAPVDRFDSNRHAIKRSQMLIICDRSSGTSPRHQNKFDDDCDLINQLPPGAHHPPQDEAVAVFRETALGIACASKDVFGTGERERLIKTLVDINPYQVGASQLFPGHTALRDAILNDLCSVEVLEILLDAHAECDSMQSSVSIYYQKDHDNLTPLDHLIISTQLGTPARAVERLKMFIRKRRSHQILSSSSFSTPETDPSPLIRLLAMGNSYEVEMSKLLQRTTPRGVISPHGNAGSRCSSSSTKDLPRLHRIVDVVLCLLDDDPSLLYKRSRMTWCLPIHIALRNYGNFEPLVRLLLDRDPCGRTMKVRNTYGDLPLHVACSVGVPLSLLRLVLNQTVQAGRSDSIKSVKNGYHHLVWSTNNSGFTPLDLEWVRNIESGNTLYAARTFYPLEATGVRKHCTKQDEFYRKLLNDAVSKTMQNETGSSVEVEANEKSVDPFDRAKEARAIFGCLLDRISLIIQSAASGTMSDESSPTEVASLFDVCKLCTPYSPNLPLPLLELYLWLRSDQITTKDGTGKLPLHYALSRDRKSADNLLESVGINDWKEFVLHLLDKSPDQVGVRSHSGRLPLHYALDHNRSPTHFEASSLTLQRSRHEVVEKLVIAFPEAVDQKDTVSGLYPYMMASMDPTLPLDTIFCLLRHSPSRCSLPPTIDKDNTITSLL